ncbi:4a-hydroxytetrahydrobiopterin dehydratase [Georgenia sp. SYP-B2076]|uniref:4a-hydroxytetrahydrobiopterin dehydratase n=1 Tax=Georgenia sp. SYP-B2076 TaxID=2495881 RepID=UPI000F8D1E9A|nr:4a-hydroxytetrahydrobiopterin dehydratase [Georgenia sp. SYP-B2076]
MRTLAAAEVQSRPGLGDWRVVAGRLRGTFRTRTMARGIELVRRIGAVADELDHHPDIDLRYFRVHVALVTHDAGGLTERDVALARRVSDIASEMGIGAEPERARQVAIAVDARDAGALVPFWRAALGYKPLVGPGEDPTAARALVDADGRGPSLSFAPAPGAGRSGTRVVIEVPAGQAPARLRAVLDAGGRLVDDATPARWVVADAEGNEAVLAEPAGPRPATKKGSTI